MVAPTAAARSVRPPSNATPGSARDAESSPSHVETATRASTYAITGIPNTATRATALPMLLISPPQTVRRRLMLFDEDRYTRKGFGCRGVPLPRVEKSPVAWRYALG